MVASPLVDQPACAESTAPTTVSKKVVIPVEHKRAFLEVPGDVAEKVDPVFYGEVKQAALKAVAAS